MAAKTDFTVFDPCLKKFGQYLLHTQFLDLFLSYRFPFLTFSMSVNGVTPSCMSYYQFEVQQPINVQPCFEKKNPGVNICNVYFNAQRGRQPVIFLITDLSTVLGSLLHFSNKYGNYTEAPLFTVSETTARSSLNLKF